eukprot:1225203-Rhodomonas_salina.2
MARTVLTCCPLRAAYAMSGTDIAYRATSSGPALLGTTILWADIRVLASYTRVISAHSRILSAYSRVLSAGFGTDLAGGDQVGPPIGSGSWLKEEQKPPQSPVRVYPLSGCTSLPALELHSSTRFRAIVLISACFRAIVLRPTLELSCFSVGTNLPAFRLSSFA